MQVIDDGDPASVMSTSTRSIAGTVETIWLIGNGEPWNAKRPMVIVRYSPGARRLGSVHAYDVREFVDDLRDLNVTPHIAQNTSNRTSAIDARTTCHPGHAISQRKRTEEPFGWAKTIGEAHAARGCTLEIQVYSDDGRL